MTAREWDKVMAARKWGRWPNTRFVEWFMRTYDETSRHRVRVLELGCGGGAQLRFLTAEGCSDFWALEGSHEAIAQTMDLLKTRWDYKYLAERMMRVDLEDIKRQPFLPADDSLDCVVDICTLQHLTANGANDTIVKARHMLKPGGKLFSIFAAPSDGDAQDWTLDLKGVPLPRLLYGHEIPHLFAGFEIRYGWETVCDLDGNERRHWIIEGTKPDA
jgi:SAM-dependent methyltransferase